MMGKQEGPGAMLSYPMQQGQRWKLPSSLLMEWYTLSLSLPLKLTRTRSTNVDTGHKYDTMRTHRWILSQFVLVTDFSQTQTRTR